MIAYKEIRDLHLEPTTLCNARCPLCFRNANAYPHNFGYPEIHMTVERLEKIFPDDFVAQLTTMDICGNFGDFVANPQALELVSWFRSRNKDLQISISTNAGARNEKFWRELAQFNVNVSFCLDGLEDTHSLYRVDTKWQTVVNNASYFIDAGGHATWKMILFEHNNHQVSECKRLAHELGFARFRLDDHGRNISAVFDRSGKRLYNIGSQPVNEILNEIINWKDRPQEKDVMFQIKESKSLNCYSENKKSIYVAANGEVYPCCFLGFYPKTFRNGHWYDQGNAALESCMSNLEINASVVGLEKALEWFDNIRKKWDIDKYVDGRLRMCDAHCGSNVYRVVDQEKFLP